jgi:hypothetical protein
VTNKHKYNFKKTVKNLRSFSRILRRVGFNGTTGKFFWKMFFTVLLKNPKAIEWGVSLSAMFIHFYKHSNFVVDLTNEQIEYIDKYGEEDYNQNRIKTTETKIANYAN